MSETKGTETGWRTTEYGKFIYNDCKDTPMAIKKGSAIPIWFSEEERLRLEEGAALRGYKHLSTYIKDRVFARADFKEESISLVPDPAWQSDVESKLELMLNDLALQRAMVLVMFRVMSKSLSGSETLALIRWMSTLEDHQCVYSSQGEVGKALQVLVEVLG